MPPSPPSRAEAARCSTPLPQPPPSEGYDHMHVNLLFALQRDLGGLQEGHRGLMALMERTRTEMHQRADRIEHRLWQLERAPPTASPPTASTGRNWLADMSTLLQQLTLLVKLSLPLAFLAAVAAYKGLHPEWLPLLRQLIAAL